MSVPQTGQRDTVEAVSKAYRVSHLWRDFIGGIATGVMLVAVALWLLIARPIPSMGVSFPLFILAFAIAPIAMSSLQFYRRRHAPTDSTNKVTYQDGTGDSVHFAPQATVAPTGTAPSMDGEHANFAIPVMRNGLSETGTIGQSTLYNQENTIIFTEHYLVGVQIPVTEGSTSDKGVGGIFVTMIAASGVGASDKNQLSTFFLQNKLKETIDEVLRAKTMQDVCNTYYSYIIPYSQFRNIELTKTNNFKLTLINGTMFNWAPVRASDFELLKDQLVAKGLYSNAT